MSALEKAEGAKRRAATAMNERSSRAHSLIVLTLEQQAAEGAGKVRSTLCLVDLGGCEKVKKSNATGERLQEAIHINQGLLALKSVRALTSASPAPRQRLAQRLGSASP